MPAKRLGSQPTPIKKHDILATTCVTEDGLLLHAALSRCEVEATNKCDIRFFHMGPPLLLGRRQFDTIGSCELSTKQSGIIDEFVDLQWGEQRAERKRLKKLGLKWDELAQYRILPPYSRPRKGSPLWCYSCVGFVLRAYEKAKVKLIVGPCPLKTVADLKTLYPEVHALLDDEDFRHHVGLSDGDKWPVVLVGYLLHAMNRPSGQINGENATPHNPQEGDEFFPSRP